MREFYPGDIVRHFKYDLYPDLVCDNANVYTYEIICTDAISADDGNRIVVYKSLYEDIKLGVKLGQVFTRNYYNFMSETDTTKYPEVKQKYRFEKIPEENT